jgi:hypothetical protein
VQQENRAIISMAWRFWQSLLLEPGRRFFTGLGSFAALLKFNPSNRGIGQVNLWCQ